MYFSLIFFTSSRDTEYLENSCVPSEELSCEYKRTDNAYPRSGINI